MFGRRRRLTTLERLAFIVFAIAIGAQVASTWAIGTPGPEPGWTTYNSEGLTFSVPSSWRVARPGLFDHWSGISAWPATVGAGGDLVVSVGLEPADLAAVYRAADGEALTISERCPADLPFQGAAHVSDATVSGGRGLMVEGLCGVGARARWRVTQFVLARSWRAGTRLYTIRLDIPDDLDADTARTFRLILDRLTF